MADRVEMHPPFSESVVQVASDAVEAFKAAGWTETKSRRSASKSDK